MRLVLESDLKVDDLVEIKIDIEDLKDSPLLGKVRNIYEMPNGRAAGIEFIDINRRVRDQIIGWLFDYQRELRKKGLL